MGAQRLAVDRPIRGGRHGSRALPWRSLGLAGVTLAAYLCLGAAPQGWVFDRLAITQGEWWRLITGHWVHGDPVHAAWDIGALVLLGWLFERRLQACLFSALAFGTLGVDLWLWWGGASLQYYCGLSGILNSVLGAGLLQLWRELRHPVVWLTGLGALGKTLLEIASGQALLTQTLWPSVPRAHAAGLLSGLLLGGLAWWLRASETGAGVAGRARARAV